MRLTVWRWSDRKIVKIPMHRKVYLIDLCYVGARIKRIDYGYWGEPIIHLAGSSNDLLTLLVTHKGTFVMAYLPFARMACFAKGGDSDAIDCSPLVSEASD